LPESALNPSIRPVRIHYREFGSGQPLIFLHGGWGYEVYPFDKQVEEFSSNFRIIIPDRSGYGRSGQLEYLPTDFHWRAAEETLGLIEELDLEKPLLWGHSDGAVISSIIGFTAPGIPRALMLEALHFYRDKPGSHDFFNTRMRSPRELGDRIVTTLSQDHGEDYWERLIRMNGTAWLRIAEESPDKLSDLYRGRLPEIEVPVLLPHGSRDPRTEPGEMDAALSKLKRGKLEMIPDAGHSPHSERTAFEECNRRAKSFLSTLETS
jgi:pimeloyl-ACP methyl ester carboxylesterase